MNTFEKEVNDIEEEILDADNSATHSERFNIFRRNYRNHALSVRILLGILVISSIIQIGLLIRILILLGDVLILMLI